VALARNLLNGKENIHFVEGDIIDNLPLVLKKGLPVDFALLDANHTYEATLAYCQMIWPYLHAESIMVIGDIHWSSGMKKAWETVKGFSGVTLSLDFFECGVLFFNPSVQRDNHILYY
jgi:cephalosporin hydroxylase